ncbi:phage major capsid protein [Micromonospora wenchangensis]|uniref:phage major capsid protein n=1 Tax=Micromonospora wenchangensis TaxID=1185415 RepID=UPI003825A8E6
MPLQTYPPAPASLSGDLITINRMLANPSVIQRRLRALTDIQFVADRLLLAKYRTSGGAVSYEINDQPLFTNRSVTAVSPGSEYPRALPQSGTAALANVSKWGQATELTDERIKRSVPMGSAVDWALRIVTNTVVQKVDRLAIAAVASGITATPITATAAWNNSGATILRDIELAKAAVDGQEMGYRADTILMTNTKYAYMVSDDKIATLRRRETTDNPVYGGEVETIAGLKVIVTPVANMPGGTDDVYVLDSQALGGMADETELDPGYATAENGVQVQTRRVAERDVWHMWARRITVPVITDPLAGRKIAST